jgi:hypothetical protein
VFNLLLFIINNTNTNCNPDNILTQSAGGKDTTSAQHEGLSNVPDTKIDMPISSGLNIQDLEYDESVEPVLFLDNAEKKGDIHTEV